MKKLLYILVLALTFALPASAAEEAEEESTEDILNGHLGDSYEWHIIGKVAIPLPCIVYSSDKGLNIFMSSHLEGGEEYNGYHIDQKSNKIVDEAGVRPFDISITKNVLQLFIVCIVLCSAILFAASWYRRNGSKKAPSGFVGIIEALVIFIDQDLAKESIGRGYSRFSSYLCTVFCFILTCNILGLIPFFPGGANLTGNIAITAVLAVSAWIAINFFAPKHYYKDIFWPDVPVFLKAPLPLMPVIEFIGVFTKPFSLMIRLFANIYAGHTIIISLTCMIFTAWKAGAMMGSSLTFVSVLLCVFMNCLELLVAFVQAYVFTLLTASFIGLAHSEE